MKLHTLQYIEILNELIDHETALYKIRVLTFFEAAELIKKITLNRHGVLFIYTSEELPEYILDNFQREFAVKLKDTQKINKYGDGKVTVYYKYVFRKVKYDHDNREFWKDNTYGESSDKLKECLVNLH